MSIENMTIREAREIASIFGGNPAKPCPFVPGSAYLIRTVTMFWLGRVRAVVGDFLVLDDAAWIADTGRYHDADSPEKFSEVEPVPKGRAVFVGLGSVVDAQEWPARLALEAK